MAVAAKDHVIVDYSLATALQAMNMAMDCFLVEFVLEYLLACASAFSYAYDLPGSGQHLPLDFDDRMNEAFAETEMNKFFFGN